MSLSRHRSARNLHRASPDILFTPVAGTFAACQPLFSSAGLPTSSLFFLHPAYFRVQRSRCRIFLEFPTGAEPRSPRVRVNNPTVGWEGGSLKVQNNKQCANHILTSIGSRGSSMDETRHGGGDEVNKEDETVMDDAQGSSMFLRTHKDTLSSLTILQCSLTSSHNCDPAPT